MRGGGKCSSKVETSSTTGGEELKMMNLKGVFMVTAVGAVVAV